MRYPSRDRGTNVLIRVGSFVKQPSLRGFGTGNGNRVPGTEGWSFRLVGDGPSSSQLPVPLCFHRLVELLQLLERPTPQMWSGSGLPWSDPEFSARMLREHLSQEHDLASRRTHLMDAYAAWIHDTVLGSRAGRILDLGCGPGLLTERLARFGHHCEGIDFAPAALEYARTIAAEHRLDCTYRLENVIDADFGSDRDLVSFIFGDLDTMPEADAARVLRRAFESLAPSGRMLLEVHTPAAVEGVGTGPASWSVQEHGLFSDHPHLLLSDAAWYPERGAASRFTVVHLATGDLDEHVVTTRALGDPGYDALIESVGGTVVDRFGDLSGHDRGPDDDFVVILAGRSN